MVKVMEEISHTVQSSRKQHRTMDFGALCCIQKAEERVVVSVQFLMFDA
jgi:hypothetical protein